MPRCPQQWLLCHVPHIYVFSHLLSPGITCPIKPPARGSLSQALLSAKAPTGLPPGPSARGANDLFSSHSAFPRTPGFCSNLLFAGFRSRHISPGDQTTLVYPITVNSQQSSLVSNHTNKRWPSAKRHPIRADPRIGWGGAGCPPSFYPSPRFCLHFRTHVIGKSPTKPFMVLARVVWVHACVRTCVLKIGYCVF